VQIQGDREESNERSVSVDRFATGDFRLAFVGLLILVLLRVLLLGRSQEVLVVAGVHVVEHL
jgi:hypothetical protein